MQVKSKTVVAIAALLLPLGLVGAGCGKPSEHAAQKREPRTIAARTVTVARVPVEGRYAAVGTVRPEFNAVLSSKLLGRVTSVNVREGDSVKSGQPLVQLDARDLRAAVSMADADLKSSIAGAGSASTAATMESRTTQARITVAESQVQQAKAALLASQARYELAQAGPRRQEVAQAEIAVAQAESSLNLAKVELDRSRRLAESGAIARRDLDYAQNRYDLAKGQHEAAVKGAEIAREGTRSQELRAAEEAVSQAKAGLQEAEAGLRQARAYALQAEVRRKDVDVARARVAQASAATESARVALSYSVVAAPFDGRVVKRHVDPGSMASPGSPLVTVEGGGMRLDAVVPERVMKDVRLGDSASVRIDALDRELVGKVVEIVPSGDPATHGFTVRVAVSRVEGLKTGMFGRAFFVTGEKQAVQIPLTATWEREGLHYVYAINTEGLARLRIVTLGETLGDSVEILSGLSPGETVVASEVKVVKDGDKVTTR